ncbi:hypothetical protein [Pseudomonas brassicacearum]|uniref:Uncharacterized protein n=1 Tax=Pseudomonas brassicacearum TaxID=930166 RepID=A0A423GUM0_9PSED|nr:hypothetical protein [Pseudomonas brassicacearum]RON01157.1 hypothetical protein BK658_08310 [Pseudomonas brassicacearum]
MISNFETALSKDEFPEYFRGTGKYFTRDPDWGTQLHIINWQGLCGFLKNQENPATILKSAFNKYLNTIKETTEDASDLLENIGCYYYMRKKVAALSENDFDLVRDMTDKEKQTISRAIIFLRNELTNANNSQDLELFNRRMTKLVNDGGPSNIESL